MASHWIGYISVPDVDAAAAKLVGQGARSLMDAFEIATVGACSPWRIPRRGLLRVSQPEGDGPAAEGRSVHWCELVTPDPEAAVACWAALSYTHETMDMPDGTYFVLKNGDALGRGLRWLSPRGGCRRDGRGLRRGADPGGAGRWPGGDARDRRAGGRALR
ncbi:MAG: hypothetical protein H6730_06990 [Deltaproteobacteria bacterium]|nr:hypothetical protein [Deltaproteobacteria bacterium]